MHLASCFASHRTGSTRDPIGLVGVESKDLKNTVSAIIQGIDSDPPQIGRPTRADRILIHLVLLESLIRDG